MPLYSFLLTLALVFSSPWWLFRMLSSGRYREGLGGRLGVIPPHLRAAVAGRKTVWVHAVSVGEVLAAQRLITELQAALPGHVIAVSTTTSTGQAIARERLPDCPVFFFPLDFRFAVRRYLRLLRPALFLTIESEFWPRMLVECERAGIPVAVVNARISDRSYPRYLRLRRLWKPLLAKVTLFLAQSEESATRLRAMGAPADRVQNTGNLKYDPRPLAVSSIAQRIKALADTRPVFVAGSTAGRLQNSALSEEEMLIQAWEGELRTRRAMLLVLAPRHPERFSEVEAAARKFRFARATQLPASPPAEPLEIILLDTIGDLASLYSIADLAFVGGSLVPKGGQNPLEPARFGVPIVMGQFYENFREIVDAMRSAKAIQVVDETVLELTLSNALTEGKAMGERAQRFFEQQSGATARTLAQLLTLLSPEVPL